MKSLVEIAGVNITPNRTRGGAGDNGWQLGRIIHRAIVGQLAAGRAWIRVPRKRNNRRSNRTERVSRIGAVASNNSIVHLINCVESGNFSSVSRIRRVGPAAERRLKEVILIIEHCSN